jgi:hypothetical protein|tara:strand:- start:341 stop:496 length:156 start_codon:yes stop_codon:yes gene_type:complete
VVAENPHRAQTVTVETVQAETEPNGLLVLVLTTPEVAAVAGGTDQQMVLVD